MTPVTQLGSSIEADFAPIEIQGQASGTRLITAEHRTHNLPVTSRCATCYATDAYNNRVTEPL